MATTFQCPACGGIIEYTSNNQEMTCPFCGTTITTPGASSAATVIMSKVDVPQPAATPAPAESAKTIVQHSTFNNSAEIIDEVKRSLREDDKAGAVRIYSKEFGVPLSDAQASVDQIEIDMKYSGKPATPPPAPEPEPVPTPTPAPAPSYSSPTPAYNVPASDVLDATPAPKKSNSKNWIIGCSVALVLCCLCIAGSSLISFIFQNMNNR